MFAPREVEAALADSNPNLRVVLLHEGSAFGAFCRIGLLPDWPFAGLVSEV